MSSHAFAHSDNTLHRLSEPVPKGVMGSGSPVELQLPSSPSIFQLMADPSPPIAESKQVDASPSESRCAERREAFSATWESTHPFPSLGSSPQATLSLLVPEVLATLRSPEAVCATSAPNRREAHLSYSIPASPQFSSVASKTELCSLQLAKESEADSMRHVAPLNLRHRSVGHWALGPHEVATRRKRARLSHIWRKDGPRSAAAPSLLDPASLPASRVDPSPSEDRIVQNLPAPMVAVPPGSAAVSPSITHSIAVSLHEVTPEELSGPRLGCASPSCFFSPCRSLAAKFLGTQSGADAVQEDRLEEGQSVEGVAGTTTAVCGGRHVPSKSRVTAPDPLVCLRGSPEGPFRHGAALASPGGLVVELKVQSHDGGDIVLMQIDTSQPMRRLMAVAAEKLHLKSELCFSVAGRHVEPDDTAERLGLSDGCAIEVCGAASCSACVSRTSDRHGPQGCFAAEVVDSTHPEKDASEDLWQSVSCTSLGPGQEGTLTLVARKEHKRAHDKPKKFLPLKRSPRTGRWLKRMPAEVQAMEQAGGDRSSAAATTKAPTTDKGSDGRGGDLAWRRYLASRRPELHQGLERQWSLLASDSQALELLKWRYGRRSSLTLSTAGADERLRSELDRLITDRGRALAIAADNEAVGGGTDGDSAAAAHSPRKRLRRNAGTDMALDRAVLMRLGLDAARMPSPLLVFLELSVAEGTSLLSEEEARRALLRWHGFGEVHHRALWSMVAHRARLQDHAIKAVLVEKGVECGETPAAPCGSFTSFLEERDASSSGCDGVAINPGQVIAAQRVWFEQLGKGDRLLPATPRCQEAAPLPWQLPTHALPDLPEPA